MRLAPIVCALIILPSLVVGHVPAQAAVASVRVTVAPPPARVEVRPVAPSPHHVWLEGHWAWRGRRYVWLPGYWALPPVPGYVWVDPRWVQEGGQWVFYDGQWVPQAEITPGAVYEPPAPPPKPIEATIAPPVPIVEVPPPVPFVGAVWISGYWHWAGARYVWVGGRWSAPRPGFAWVEPRWQHAGPHWRFVPGHWRHG
jgi:WXXGXW repeat (2 copies)